MLVLKIKELCRIYHIRISRLERELGLGNGTIRKWGSSSPSVDKLCKVADFFDVRMDDLLDGPTTIRSMDAVDAANKYDNFRHDNQELLRRYLKNLQQR